MSITRHLRHNNPYSATRPVIRRTVEVDRRSGAIVKTVVASSPSSFDGAAADSHSDTSSNSSSSRTNEESFGFAPPAAVWFPRPSMDEIAQRAFCAPAQFKAYATWVTDEFAKQRPVGCGGVQIALLPKQQQQRGIADPRHIHDLHSFAVELGAGIAVGYPTTQFCHGMQLQQQHNRASRQDEIVTLHVGGVSEGTTPEQLIHIVFSITDVLPESVEWCRNTNNDLSNSVMFRVAGGMDVANRVIRCIDRRVLLDETCFIFAATKAQTERLDAYCSVLKYYDQLRYQMRPYQPLTVTIAQHGGGTSPFHERHPLCPCCAPDMEPTYAVEQAGCEFGCFAPAGSPLRTFFDFMKNHAQQMWKLPGVQRIATHSSAGVGASPTPNCRNNLCQKMRDKWPQIGFAVPRACARHRCAVPAAYEHYTFEEQFMELQKDLRGGRKLLRGQ